MSQNKQRIAIVGGGTAGWMAAAAFSKVLPPEHYNITIVESATTPTVGVGEATIPPIETFNRLLGIDSNELLKATNGSYKLGIEFINWGEIGESYYHPFGSYGTDFNNLPFYQYWQRHRAEGSSLKLGDFSITAQMAALGKFVPAQNIANSPLAKIQHAYHFDATLYAQYLRIRAELQGITRIEGDVVEVRKDPENGFLSSLKIAGHGDLNADFFIDCTGFSALLIEKSLNTGFESWAQFLPCDKAKVIGSLPHSEIASHTKAIAHGFGWQWRIPLQHRIGNGLVYSSELMSDENAEKSLMCNLETEAIGEIKQLNFIPGKRIKIWNKNCLALGLSSGFLEPLESTSIHLVQSAISKFLSLFPDFNNFENSQRRFNTLIDQQIYSIRDFIILHYKATKREDTEFWKYCKNMEIPDSLQEKIDLYKSSGYLVREENELFSENSWLSVLEGQGIKCLNFNPLTKQLPTELLSKNLDSICHTIKKAASKAPAHSVFIKNNCLSKLSE